MAVDIGIAAAARGRLSDHHAVRGVGQLGGAIRSQSSLRPHGPLLSPNLIRTNNVDVTWVRLFFSERRRNRYLASRVSLAARLPRARPGSGRLRPARCESVPAGAGTPSHRAGYGGGGAARNRAANGTAEADAGHEAPREPLAWPRTHQATLTPQKPHPCDIDVVGEGTRPSQVDIRRITSITARGAR